MTEITVTSNANVKINIAPFGDAMALKNSIQKEFADSDFKFDFDTSKSLSEQDFDVASIAKIAALVDSSEAVNEALMKCLLRCTYNSEKITLNTFEDEDARGDYYEIVIACLKANILPFYKGLLSKFLPAIQAIQTASTKESSPEQK